MTGAPAAALLGTALALVVAATVLALAPATTAGPWASRARSPGQVRRILLALGPAAVASALLLDPGVHTALGGVAALSGWGLLRLDARARRARVAAERRDRVLDFGEALLGELRAGQPLLRCLERSTGAGPEAEAVASAARLGADVPTALRRVAGRPGAEGLLGLAAAWHLCAGLGSGLAVAVERVVEGIRAEQATSRLVEAELASARATARLVAALPLLVLLVAQGVGADPWNFLFGTWAGVSCLAVGCALMLGGLEWIDRIAESARSGGL